MTTTTTTTTTTSSTTSTSTTTSSTTTSTTSTTTTTTTSTTTAEVLVIGITGVDFLEFGSGGSVGVEGFEVIGLQGFDLLEFGSGGSVGSNYTVVGVHGKPSTLRFGVGGVVILQRSTLLEYKQPWTVADTDVYFRSQKDVNPSARYFPSLTIDLINGPSMVAPWRMPKIPPAVGDRIITVQVGEEARLDILAHIEWGRSEWWWILALANDILNPFEEPVAGDRLRAPTTSRILNEILGATSTGQEVSRVRERF